MHHFLRLLDSFKTGFGQLLVVWLVAFETKISHVLVLDTIKIGFRHIVVAFKALFRHVLDKF